MSIDAAAGSSPASAFAVVTDEDFSLRDTGAGPVLATDSGGVLYELSADGDVRPLSSFIAWASMNGNDPSTGFGSDKIAAVVGRWPDEVFVEIMQASVDEPWSKTVRVTEEATAPRKVLSGPYLGHYHGSSPWSDGRLLTFLAAGNSQVPSNQGGWTGSFHVLGGAPAAVPKLPKDASLVAFAAYPSGSILVG